MNLLKKIFGKKVDPVIEQSLIIYKAKVLKQLKDGKRVTNDSIYQDFHTHDGRKIISEIRKMGIAIKTSQLPANGTKPRNEYFLEVA